MFKCLTMTYILINDILDELRDECDRLFKENQLIHNFIDKYRMFSLNFQKFCVCNQKSNNDFVIQSLEDEYQSLTNQRDRHSLKSEELIPILKIKHISDENVRQKSKTLLRSNRKKAAEDLDTNYEVSDGNSRRFTNKYEERLNRHICSHEGCGQRFDRNSRLIQHMEREHNSEPKGLQTVLSIDGTDCDITEGLQTEDTEDMTRYSLHNSDLRDNQLSAENVGNTSDNRKKGTEYIDSDYDVNNGSDTEVSDYSEEELKKKKTYSRSGRKKKFICSYEGCAHRTEKQRDLQTHIRRIHTKEKPFKCEDCGEGFISNYYLNDHKTIHSGVTFECEECHKVFLKRSLYLIHRRTTHSSVNITDSEDLDQNSDYSNKKLKKKCCPIRKGCVCPYPECDHRTKSQRDLQTHIRRIHTKEKPFKCEDCGEGFVSNYYLNDHKTIHSGLTFECEECHKVFPKRSLCVIHRRTTHSSAVDNESDAVLKDHESIDSGNRYKCEECNKLFGSNLKLKYHMRYHSTKIVCSYIGCGHRTNKKCHMEAHIRRIHTLEKPYKCDECNEQFVLKHYLTDHKSVHSGEKFECKVCHKVFPRKMLLRYHMEIHKDKTNLPVHQCSQCDFKTKNRRTLRSHVRCVHEVVEQGIKCDVEGCHLVLKNEFAFKAHKRRKHSNRQWTCDWPGCEMVCKTNALIKDHMMTHEVSKQFKCDYEGCHKAFNMKKRLNFHKTSHSLPYECSWPQCGERFMAKAILEGHMNRHINVRPYECTVDDCGKRYFNSRNLGKHRREVHKIKIGKGSRNCTRIDT